MKETLGLLLPKEEGISEIWVNEKIEKCSAPFLREEAWEEPLESMNSGGPMRYKNGRSQRQAVWSVGCSLLSAVWYHHPQDCKKKKKCHWFKHLEQYLVHSSVQWLSPPIITISRLWVDVYLPRVGLEIKDSRSVPPCSYWHWTRGNWVVET